MNDLQKAAIVLKFEDWPESDRVAWTALLDHSFFGEEGSFAHFREGSVSIYRQAYGQWLSFLKRNVETELLLPPCNRIRPSLVKTYVQECTGRLADRSVLNLLLGLYLTALGMDEDRDWTWFGSLLLRLKRKVANVGLKPSLPVSAREIWDWSLSRMSVVESDPNLAPLQRAVRFRQALMFAVLIACPVRRRAFLGITVDQHLSLRGDRPRLRFSVEDMKDKSPHDFVLPDALRDPLEHYIDYHRPILLGSKRSPSLWINQYGDPITPDGYSREIYNLTKKHFGVGFRTHAFRHIAATSIAETDPEHVGIIVDVLGHATLDTAYKHYNRASAKTAVTSYQDVIGSIRKEAQRIEAWQKGRQSP